MLRRILYNKLFISTLQKQLLRTYSQPIQGYIRSGSISYAVHVNNAQGFVPRCHYSETVKVNDIIVDYDHVKDAISNNKIIIVDVREPEEVKEHGKIPNSINIPLGNVSTAFGTMSDREFETIYKRPKPSEDSEIIFYCMIGKRSGMAQQNALNLGYKNVKNYLGSWTEWATKTQ